jgi:hypothetical protein
MEPWYLFRTGRVIPTLLSPDTASVIGKINLKPSRFLYASLRIFASQADDQVWTFPKQFFRIISAQFYFLSLSKNAQNYFIILTPEGFSFYPVSIPVAMVDFLRLLPRLLHFIVLEPLQPRCSADLERGLRSHALYREGSGYKSGGVLVRRRFTQKIYCNGEVFFSPDQDPHAPTDLFTLFCFIRCMI